TGSVQHAQTLRLSSGFLCRGRRLRSRQNREVLVALFRTLDPSGEAKPLASNFELSLHIRSLVGFLPLDADQIAEIKFFSHGANPPFSSKLDGWRSRLVTVEHHEWRQDRGLDYRSAEEDYWLSLLILARSVAARRARRFRGLAGSYRYEGV